MVNIRKYVVTLLFVLTSVAGAAEGHRDIEHIVVYKEEGRFGGWPANNGIWNWGDEIVVGFTLGYYKKNPTGGHDIDRDKPSVVRQARSYDGGKTWRIEVPSFLDREDREAAPVSLKKPIDFSNPDLTLRFARGNFYYSTDRAIHWNGPYVLPTFGRPGLLSRTDYLVEGRNRVTAFTTAQKDGGGEGQPLCMRTTDGGVTWELIGWIGPQPPATYGYAIMPSTVRIPGDGYFSMIRRGAVFDGKRRWWMEALPRSRSR